MKKQKHASLLCTVMISILMLVMCNPAVAFAGVEFTTEENPAYETVGITGHPNYYPFESFNTETGEYEGLFPMLFEVISEKSGLNFEYINCSTKDTRLTDQKTGYAQIISAYICNEKEMGHYLMTNFVPIMNIDQKGENVTIGFAFGKYAEAEVIEKITAVMEGISTEDINTLLGTYLAEKEKDNNPALYYIIIGALIMVVLGVSVILILQIRKKKQLANQVKTEETNDFLTGVKNKAYFENQFRSMSSNRQRASYIVAYIAFDIQKVNKYFGEKVSEDLLCFAANLISNYQNHDKHKDELVARVAGGAFAVLHICSTEGEAKIWAEGLTDRLNAGAIKFEMGYQPKFRTGVYRLPVSNWDYPKTMEIVKSCYDIAQKINADYYVYNEETDKQRQLDEILKRDFETALKERQIIQFLQPIVDNDTEDIVLAEGLARWQHPEMGLMTPGRFIHLVIETEKILELDLYMFEESCKKLDRMKKDNQNYKISTNFTRTSISSPDFIHRIVNIAGKYDFTRENLIMEITEDLIENDKDLALKNMKTMKELGFSLALDDVGSKFSFFSDLSDYQLDYIKLDKNIINKSDDVRGLTIFTNLLATCKMVGIKTICEGVETREQRRLVKKMGCDYIQGYFFYKPLSPDEARNIMK